MSPLSGTCLEPCRGIVYSETRHGTATITCHELELMNQWPPMTLSQGNCIVPLQGHFKGSEISLNGQILIACSLALYFSWVLYNVKMHTRKVVQGSGSATMKCQGLKTGTGTIVPWRILLPIYLLGWSSACIRVDETGLFMHSEGLSVCTENGNFVLNQFRSTIETQHLYRTQEWELEVKSEWACAGGSCPMAADCAQRDGRQLTGRLAWVSCKNYYGSCAFGRGCRLGTYEVKPKGSEWTVMSMSSMKYDHAVGRQHGCNISLVAGTISLDLHQYLVVGNLSQYICRDASPTGLPRVGMLGDLQKTQDNTYFDQDSLRCTQDFHGGLKCNGLGSFAPGFSGCRRLPAHLSGGLMEWKDGQLHFSREISTPMKIECDTKLLETLSNCHLSVPQRWGARGTPYGTYIVVSAHSDRKHEDVIFQHPCTGKKHRIPCDGKQHFFPDGEELCDHVLDLTTSEDNYHKLIVSPLMKEPNGIWGSKWVWVSAVVTTLFAVLCMVVRFRRAF